jgi:hypothetical protein
LNCLDYGFDVTAGDPTGVNVSVHQPEGNVSFYPSLHWYGLINVSFWVYDGIAKTYSNNVTLNISHVNIPPSITPNMTNYSYVYFSYQVQASDVENDSLTYSISSSTLSDVQINGTTGLIGFLSNSSDVGNHTVNVTASDGVNQTTVSFNLEILQNARPLVLPFAGQTMLQHNPYSVIINASDSDNDNLTFYSNWSVISPGERYNSTAWNFSATVDDQSMVGVYFVRLTVVDGRGSESALDFTMTVQDLDMPPIIYPISVPNSQIKVNTSINLTAYAFDEEGTIQEFSDNATIFDINTTSTGSMSTNATGVISFKSSQIGFQTINLSINDSASQVNWTILLLNKPPTLL